MNNARKRTIIIGCLTGILFCSCSASIFAQGVLKDENLSSIRSKAVRGDSYYQGVLALFYKYGEKGLSIHMTESERWAKMAAKQGSGIGMAVLASIELENGNKERGQFLYDEAYLHSNLRDLAKSKDPIALFCIGLMEIDNPPANPSKGIRNIENSAELGLATAQATLGVIKLTGSQIERHKKEGIKWCSLAASHKLPLGMFYLGMAYSFGDGVPKNQDFANRWIRAAADRGLTAAQFALGMRLATGDGIQRNLEHGAAWLRKAEAKGHSQASVQLRRFETLLKSSRLSQNSTKQATKRSIALKRSIKESSPDANLKMGLKKYRSKEYAEAEVHFNKAAEDSDPTALRYLGIMHFLGQQVEMDYEKAKDLLTRAEQAGDQEAKRYLGLIEKMSR